MAELKESITERQFYDEVAQQLARQRSAYEMGIVANSYTFTPEAWAGVIHKLSAILADDLQQAYQKPGPLEKVLPPSLKILSHRYQIRQAAKIKQKIQAVAELAEAQEKRFQPDEFGAGKPSVEILANPQKLSLEGRALTAVLLISIVLALIPYENEGKQPPSLRTFSGPLVVWLSRLPEDLEVYAQTETPTPGLVITDTPTFRPSETVTLQPSLTASPLPTETKTPSATPTATATETLTPTPSETASPKPSRTPTRTMTPSPVPTETSVPTHIPTPTETPLPTETPSPMPTNTPEPSSTPSPTTTETPTSTPTATATETETVPPAPELPPAPTLQPGLLLEVIAEYDQSSQEYTAKVGGPFYTASLVTDADRSYILIHYGIQEVKFQVGLTPYALPGATLEEARYWATAMWPGLGIRFSDPNQTGL